MNGNKLYAWQEQEPNGDWEIIAAAVPMLGNFAALVTRERRVATELFGPIAKAHAKASGRAIRLGHFDLTGTGERTVTGER